MFAFFSKIKKVEKLSPTLRSLYLHKVIRDLGVGVLGLFGPIFWYVISGESWVFVAVYYGLLYTTTILILPWWAKLIKSFSMHIMMMVGTLSMALYFVGLYGLDQAHRLEWGWLAVLVFLAQFNHCFYWIPYHIDFARFVNKNHRGRQLSFLSILVSLVGIVLPVFSGFVIDKFGYSVLYVFGMVIVFISILPLFFIQRTREEYAFGYLETFKKLFAKQHFRTNLAYVADGCQGFIGSIVWPVFIFMLLRGKYLEIGLISAGIVLVICILQFVTGEIVDKRNKQRLIKTGSLLYSLGWVLKAIVSVGWQIFLVGIYHDLMGIFFRTPFDVLTYEIAADAGHYVDEFTVLREMTLHFGRVIAAIISLVIFSLSGSLVWIFVLGAGVALVTNMLNKREFV